MSISEMVGARLTSGLTGQRRVSMSIPAMVGARLGRRRFLMIAGAAAGSAILAACGGSSTATDTPKAAAPTTAAATTAPASAAAATRPAGSVAASTVGAIAPVASTTASSTTAIGSATTASGSAAASATGGIQTMVIEAFDYGFKTLGSIPGGPTRVQMKNTGKEVHHAQFMLPNPGVTPEQIVAAVQKGPDVLFASATWAGGPGVAQPGGSTEVILDLKEGQYMLACFVPGDDHIPHIAKGMMLPLTVTAPAVAAPTTPAVNGAITLFDFTITMPDTLPAGKSMYTVTNTGAQIHELIVIQIAPGKTADDVKAYFDAPRTAPPGPLPGTFTGGMNALSHGGAGVVTLDLTPGTYAAICLIPDQSMPHGRSHLHLGMVKGFTVK